MLVVAAVSEGGGMTPSVAHGTRAASRHTGWWQAPLVSTVVATGVLPVAVFLGMWSVMATDPCNSAADCPKTFAALARTEWLILASAMLGVLQWLPAYWIPRKGRWLLAVMPPLLALAAIGSVFATPAGQ